MVKWQHFEEKIHKWGIWVYLDWGLRNFDSYSCFFSFVIWFFAKNLWTVWPKFGLIREEAIMDNDNVFA